MLQVVKIDTIHYGTAERQFAIHSGRSKHDMSNQIFISVWMAISIMQIYAIRLLNKTISLGIIYEVGKTIWVMATKTPCKLKQLPFNCQKIGYIHNLIGIQWH